MAAHRAKQRTAPHPLWSSAPRSSAAHRWPNWRSPRLPERINPSWTMLRPRCTVCPVGAMGNPPLHDAHYQPGQYVALGLAVVRAVGVCVGRGKASGPAAGWLAYSS